MNNNRNNKEYLLSLLFTRNCAKCFTFLILLILCLLGSQGGGFVAQSCLTLATPRIVACPAPLFMRFSRQEYWNGLRFPSPGYLPDSGIKPRSPALQAISLPTELQFDRLGCRNNIP